MLGCVKAVYTQFFDKEGTADHEANLHHHHARPRGRFFESKPLHCGRGRANITRVSYNKAVDMHILFIEVEGTPDQLSRVERELGAMGYLPDGQRPATVILLEPELEDRPGEVLPVLELIDRFHFNISYISSQENGGACQHFRMGLLVEDEAAVSRFMREASTLCPVRVIHYDHAEKNLDNTAFYLNFAGEVGRRAGLDQQDRRELMVNANQVMQMLDGRDEAPYKTFEYIGKFAAQLDACRGDAYEVRLTEWQGRCGARMRVAEPPAGCNVTVIEKDGEVLFVGPRALPACGRRPWRRFPRWPGISAAPASARPSSPTQASVDHCGLLDLYDDVYMSRKCLQNFEWERAEGAKSARAQPRARALCAHRQAAVGLSAAHGGAPACGGRVACALPEPAGAHRHV